ncbi:hypothetical protein [Streptomyces sp. CA-106110]|uniref:hypothetical protein n=1 Tax=Streptomyces sp. CA-106110 TaxID=3240044 RepID=UPI003D91B59C
MKLSGGRLLARTSWWNQSSLTPVAARRRRRHGWRSLTGRCAGNAVIIEDDYDAEFRYDRDP